ncbi:MAG TPA: 2-dehydropantoate 2-reductase N-terminal domain-containing protein [Microbacterium sp.]|uniref:ketopantoate reductase family protein n=1 Tax=Microbacterium sp. TaxID=51671 RepID=UPI002B6AC95F|nr:2-dehydropantoate 2-reductase N-terminal domain-containing protein [Microbacterium sp.]HWI32472.1 2-dehydropantoate 2-reductase N-terminal domain-containing protein [Microbacterium sp.]
MSRYIVIGAGALGALLAAQWTTAKLPVTLVARGASYDAIRSRGVRIRRPEGDDVIAVDVVASIAEAKPLPSDTIVLAVKSQDAESAIAQIAWVPLADRSGVVADLPILTLQNGLASEDAALRRFDRVIGVSIGIPASHLEPGVVVSPAKPVVGVAWIGGYPSSQPSEEERHRGAFALAGFAALIEPDIAAAKRRKLIANLRNVVDVFEAALEEQEHAEAALTEEARRVFAAARLAVAPPPWDAPRLEVADVPGHEPGHLSTWQSFARGASSEVDFLSGEIALIARQHGVAAPLNAAVARELGALAARGGRPGEVPLPPEFASGSLTREHLRA